MTTSSTIIVHTKAEFDAAISGSDWRKTTRPLRVVRDVALDGSPLVVTR